MLNSYLPKLSGFVSDRLSTSFQRKLESMLLLNPWIPAFAAMTKKNTITGIQAVKNAPCVMYAQISARRKGRGEEINDFSFNHSVRRTDMENGFNAVAGKGLEFFGKITASISHELKNSLAIINEKAGLLEDFALMANQGIPLDPDRLESLAGQIIKQIGRANDIIRTLNVFAHSAEEPLKNADLAEILTLAVRLCSRFADMKSITLAPKIPEDPMTIKTRPFFAEHLICHCLTMAMNRPGIEKKIEIAMEPSEDHVQIHIFPLDTKNQLEGNSFQDQEIQMLAEALHARVEPRRESGKLSLVFPRSISCLDAKI